MVLSTLDLQQVPAQLHLLLVHHSQLIIWLLLVAVVAVDNKVMMLALAVAAVEVF